MCCKRFDDMNIPNQNLSPKEETLQLFNSIVSELDYSGCMNLQYALSSRIDILNKIPDKRKLLEPKMKQIRKHNLQELF